MLLGAEWAVKKHTGLYFESGDSTAKNTGNLIGFTKGWFTILVFPVMLFVRVFEFPARHLSVGLAIGRGLSVVKGTLGR